MPTEKRKRRKYTEDFKREAVALVTEQGYTISGAARSLDINDNMLRRWKQAFEAEASGAGLSPDSVQESLLASGLRRLILEIMLRAHPRQPGGSQRHSLDRSRHDRLDLHSEATAGNRR